VYMYVHVCLCKCVCSVWFHNLYLNIFSLTHSLTYNGDVSSSFSNEVTHVVLSNVLDVDKVWLP